MALTNCTNLVRERKNRFRTCYPQRTSKPAAILASSLSTDLEISRRREGSPTESSNSAIWPPIEILLLHSCLTPGSRKSSRFKSSLTGPAAPNMCPWPETRSLLRIHPRKNLVLWIKGFLLHTVYRKFLKQKENVTQVPKIETSVTTVSCSHTETETVWNRCDWVV